MDIGTILWENLLIFSNASLWRSMCLHSFNSNFTGIIQKYSCREMYNDTMNLVYGQNDMTVHVQLCSSPLENPSFCVTVRAILDVVASLYRYTSSSLYQSTWLRLNCRLWMAVRWWGEGHVDNIKEHSLHSLTGLYSNTPHSSQSKWHKTTGSSAFQCTDMSGFL